jgi:hypothetical protein
MAKTDISAPVLAVSLLGLTENSNQTQYKYHHT